MYSTDYISVYEFFELMEFTLSFKFRDKWKDRFSERLIKLFQIKLLKSFTAQKTIKKTTLVNYLINKGNYSPKVVEDFFEAIEIELYIPFIS